MTRVGGFRRKKLGVFTKKSRQKGKISQRAYLAEYKAGDKVVLKLEAGIQKATYYPRFHGKTGIVKKKEGSSYRIEIMDGDKTKEVVAHPIHLKKA